MITGEDRGPVLEVIVSRTNFISSHTSKGVRVVGLSTALANARDLADWLGIKQVRKPAVNGQGQRGPFLLGLNLKLATLNNITLFSKVYCLFG